MRCDDCVDNDEECALCSFRFGTDDDPKYCPGCGKIYVSMEERKFGSGDAEWEPYSLGRTASQADLAWAREHRRA